MSDIIERTFKCTGCGEARPCFLTTNQAKGEIAFYDHAEYLKCVLDETNQTAHNWQEVQANGVDKSTEQALHKHIVSKRSELLIGLLTMLEKEGGNEFIDKAEIVAKYEANL